MCTHVYGYIDHFTIDEQKGADLTGLIRRLSCFIVIRMQQNQIFSRRGPKCIFIILGMKLGLNFYYRKTT